MSTNLPGEEIQIVDPGMGSSEPTSMRPLIIGPSSKGALNVLTSWSEPADFVSAYGQGDLTELGAYVLTNGGGPVLALRTEATVAGANGAVSPSRVGTSTGTITVAGTAYDKYAVTVRIRKSGALGAGEFDYTLDGRTWSSQMTIPAGGTYAIANTGLTLTFVPGAGPTFFELGDSHAFSTTSPWMNVTDLATAMTAILASPLAWRFLVLAGKAATASAAATMFAALATHMTNMEATFRYRRAMMDAGSDTTANVATSFASQFSPRILVSYGDMDVISAKPFVGWGSPTRQTLLAFARNATGPNSQGWGYPSTDLKRVLGGPIPGVISAANGAPAISHDEYKNEVLDALGISTTRTYPNSKAAHITQGRLKSVPGSDFRYWPHGIVMDIACEVVFSKQLLWIGDEVRTNANGSIDVRDRGRIEKEVQGALDAALMQQKRAGGRDGFAQEVLYSIDENHNVFNTRTILSTVRIKPLTSIDKIKTSLGYVSATILAPNVNVGE